jgi:hypothetical protein
MFVPDYEPDEKMSSRRLIRIIFEVEHNRGRRCPSCPGRFTNVRRHVLRNHLPWYISPATACWECRLQYSQTSLLDTHLKEFHNASAEGQKFDSSRHQLWVEVVNGLLEALCAEPKCSSILGLCRFAEEHIKFKKNYEPVFQENNLLWLIDWLIDWCLTSSEQFFSYIQDDDLLWVCVFNQLNHIQSTVSVLQWRRLFMCTHYYIGRYCPN